MNKIEKLAPGQESRIAEWRQKWIGVGIATGPTPDRRSVEAAIEGMYKRINLPPPIFVWADSPITAGMSLHVLRQMLAVGAQVWAQVRDQVGAQVRDQVGDQVGDQVRDQVWAQVGAQVWAQVRDQVGAQVRDQVGDQVGDQVRDQVWAQVGAQVWAQVRDQVWAQVRDQVGDQVGDQVRDQVWAQVGAQVWAQVGDQVWDQVWDQVGDQVWDQVGAFKDNCLWGQHDVGWIAFATYFRDVLGITLQEITASGLSLFEEASDSGWYGLWKGVCVISDRPSICHRNEEGRLHCDDGPALQYTDGFSVWSIGGVRVDEQIVLRPETQTVEQIDSEQNEEKRRVRISRFAGRGYEESEGWLRYLKLSGSKVIQHRDNAVEGTKETLVVDTRKARHLITHCPSTGKMFCLDVPEQVNTCEDAQAYLWSGSRIAELVGGIRIVGRS